MTVINKITDEHERVVRMRAALNKIVRLLRSQENRENRIIRAGRIAKKTLRECI